MYAGRVIARPFLVVAWMLSAASGACGGAVDIPDDSETGVADAGDDGYVGRIAAPISGAFGKPGACATPCPTLPPKADDACAPERVGIECEYGELFDPKCNTVARCVANGTLARWTIVRPSGACPTTAQLQDVVCPSSPFGPERGKACSLDGAMCTYVDGVCGCSGGGGDSGTDLTWSCAVFTCKGPRMRLGCSCSGALACQHGGCTGTLDHGVDIACNADVWKRPVNCQ